MCISDRTKNGLFDHSLGFSPQASQISVWFQYKSHCTALYSTSQSQKSSVQLKFSVRRVSCFRSLGQKARFRFLWRDNFSEARRSEGIARLFTVRNWPLRTPLVANTRYYIHAGGRGSLRHRSKSFLVGLRTRTVAWALIGKRNPLRKFRSPPPKPPANQGSSCNGNGPYRTAAVSRVQYSTAQYHTVLPTTVPTADLTL